MRHTMDQYRDEDGRLKGVFLFPVPEERVADVLLGPKAGWVTAWVERVEVNGQTVATDDLTVLDVFHDPLSGQFLFKVHSPGLEVITAVGDRLPQAVVTYRTTRRVEVPTIDGGSLTLKQPDILILDPDHDYWGNPLYPDGIPIDPHPDSTGRPVPYQDSTTSDPKWDTGHTAESNHDHWGPWPSNRHPSPDHTTGGLSP